MKKLILAFAIVPFLSFGQNHQANLKKIYDTELSAGHTYDNLRYLCKVIGNRLSGSPGAAASPSVWLPASGKGDFPRSAMP